MTGQRELIQRWWQQVAEPTRTRLLGLAAGDFLPSDVALELQMVGVTVIAVGTVAVAEGYDALYEQPEPFREVLEEARGQVPAQVPGQVRSEARSRS
jgi:hypothetical protein